jgi:hypothetical protein
MNKELLPKVFAQFFGAIDHCTEKRFRTPALILIFSFIDLLSSLHSDNKSVRLRFTEWVDKYLLPGTHLKCTSIDLYGARCGLVHTSSPESDLSKTGKASKIAYAWSPATSSDLEKLISLGLELDKNLGQRKLDYLVAVQVEEFIAALHCGVDRFLAELKGDPTQADRVYERATQIFIDLPDEDVAELIRRAQEVLKE